jgi:hypothetical protein
VLTLALILVAAPAASAMSWSRQSRRQDDHRPAATMRDSVSDSFQLPRPQQPQPWFRLTLCNNAN